MAHRDFNKERAALEPVTFTLGHNPDGTDRVFTCRRSVSPEAVMSYESMSADAPLSVTIPIVDALVKSILVDGDHAAWDACRAEVGDETVSVNEFGELAAWLVEQVVSRPTVAPASSSAGATTPPTGTSSTDGSPSPVAVASTA